MSISATANPHKGEAALALRLAGASYDEIAQVCGYTEARYARRGVVDALARSATEADRAYHRNRAHQRLEILLDAVWDKAIHPNDEQLPAVRAAREIVHEMVLLQGAAAPAEVIVHNPTTSQLLEWMAQNGLTRAPTVIEVDPFADAEGGDDG